MNGVATENMLFWDYNRVTKKKTTKLPSYWKSERGLFQQYFDIGLFLNLHVAINKK
jgi:hypothetical protein